MNLTQDINKVYELYQSGDFKEAQILNNTVLQYDPRNIYAQRYAHILEKKLKINTSQEKTHSVKIKGKNLKCPHCTSKIPFSSLSILAQNSIKSGNYSNLELKCAYCHIVFILQKKASRSFIGIKIGDTATIDGKNYRATGYVEYKGMWYEGNYQGKTEYLEWLLFNSQDNSYYYFSEGKSYDEGSIEYEYELSHKVTPNFSIPTRFSERVTAKVVSIYGENSKQFTVGESIELGSFSQGGNEYVIEKEGVGRQKEAGIYEIETLSQGQSFSLFGKKASKMSSKPHKFVKIFMMGFILLPIVPFSIFQPFFTSFMEKQKEVQLKDISHTKKTTLYFNDSLVKKHTTTTSSTRYSYGGVRTFYSQNQGLNFSVQSDEDTKIIEKLKLLIKEGSQLEIVKMFEGKIYYLK